MAFVQVICCALSFIEGYCRWKFSNENLYTFIRPNQEQLLKMPLINVCIDCIGFVLVSTFTFRKCLCLLTKWTYIIFNNIFYTEVYFFSANLHVDMIKCALLTTCSIANSRLSFANSKP
jgi:hypothetical protein